MLSMSKHNKIVNKSKQSIMDNRDVIGNCSSLKTHIDDCVPFRLK